MPAIKNIIFDLGGVLLNIDYNKTTIAFEKLGIENFDELFSQFKANDLFEKLETGQISEDEFYQSILQHTNTGADKKQIQQAWDAMLLDFRIESLEFLKPIKGKYNIYLLSNTNSIHLSAFQKILFHQTGDQSLNGYFIKSYYSHLIGKRKPWPETYLYVLNDAELIPEETLFIDDSINNIEAAKHFEIKTHLLLPNERIEKLQLDHLISSKSI